MNSKKTLKSGIEYATLTTGVLQVTNYGVYSCDGRRSIVFHGSSAGAWLKINSYLREQCRPCTMTEVVSIQMRLDRQARRCARLLIGCAMAMDKWETIAKLAKLAHDLQTKRAELQSGDCKLYKIIATDKE